MSVSGQSASELLGFAYRFVPGESNHTLLLLHGTGGDENDLIELGQAVAPGMALISPRGKVLEHGMPRFFRRLAEGVFDQADLQRRTDELAEFIDAACAQHGRDPGHMIALGFSNGANIAAAVLLKHPAALEGTVLIRAMVPFEPAASPSLAGKRILMLSGQTDPIVPRANAERLAEIFRSGGAELTQQWVRGGHGLTGEDVKFTSEWIAELPNV